MSSTSVVTTVFLRKCALPVTLAGRMLRVSACGVRVAVNESENVSGRSVDLEGEPVHVDERPR